jgi:hypothetical protein
MKMILCGFLFVMANHLAFGQPIDSLKLKDVEIPRGYSKSDQLMCVTPHASSLYDQVDLYASFFGKVTNKAFQSYYKKGDKGSILYFEFDKAFVAQAFLNGLLWGQETKPTKSEPDEYYTKGNILIIWSYNLNSELKQISEAKVKQLLP